MRGLSRQAHEAMKVNRGCPDYEPNPAYATEGPEERERQADEKLRRWP